MRTLLIISSLLAGSLLARAQDYAVSRIPPHLLQNADAVKRVEETTYEMISLQEALMHQKIAITVLNEKGSSRAVLAEYYDKLRQVTNVEGALYDANGKQLKRLKNKQILDFAGLDENNLADDDRVKYHQFFRKEYPYTVEYEVDIRFRNTVFLPSWMPVDAEGLAVEKSSFSITVPATYNLRFQAFNSIKDPVITPVKNKKTYQWETGNLKAARLEFAAPPWYESSPFLLTGPSEFFIENYSGNLSSWNEFGKFVYALKKGKDILPASIKTAVHQLTDTVNDIRTKINMLYYFLQKNTRYISVQLGIGGWQPFDAGYVATNGYGDCKALTNYMYSILKEAGILSCYTLVKAGENASPLIDFPSQQFNHVILMVPLSKDTLWLECTSNTLPAGYLSGFTADRLALAITESGGVLVHTPKYTKEQNFSNRMSVGELDANGDLYFRRKAIYSGQSQDPYHYLINSYATEKLKEKLQESMDLVQPEIRSLHYLEKETATPAIEEDLEISARNYASSSGKRLFLTIPLTSKWNMVLSADSNRKTEILFQKEYIERDTIVISLPKGFTVESKPNPLKYSSPLGEFNSSVQVTDQGIIFTRYLQHNAGRFLPALYGELVKFYETIYRSDHARVVLKADE